MAYLLPKPQANSLLQVANMQMAAGNVRAAHRMLYRNGRTWADLNAFQAANTPFQRRPREMSLPASLRGFGAEAAPAPAPAPAPADLSIQEQLAAIRIDWRTGILWVGQNKYSLLTTLVGGLVIKGMLMGGSGIAGLGKRLVGGKQVPA